MNPAAEAEADDVLDEEREVIKLRYACEACGLMVSVGPKERGKLDSLVRAHLNTAAERYGTPCAEDTIVKQIVYNDGSTEAL